MSKKHRGTRTFEHNSRHKEEAEEKFITRMNKILNALSVTVGEVPGVVNMPAELSALVGATATSYDQMNKLMREYERRTAK